MQRLGFVKYIIKKLVEVFFKAAYHIEVCHAKHISTAANVWTINQFDCLITTFNIIIINIMTYFLLSEISATWTTKSVSATYK